MQLDSQQVQNSAHKASYRHAVAEVAAVSNSGAYERRVALSSLVEPVHEHDTMLREFYEFVVGLGFAHLWPTVATRIHFAGGAR